MGRQRFPVQGADGPRQYSNMIVSQFPPTPVKVGDVVQPTIDDAIMEQLEADIAAHGDVLPDENDLAALPVPKKRAARKKAAPK